MLLKIYITAIVLFGFLSLKAQEQTAVIPFLNTLESQFDVKFAYKTEDLEHLKIRSATFENLTLALEYIQEKSPLEVEKLSDRYIALKLKTSTLSYCAILKDATNFSVLAGAEIRVTGTNQGGISGSEGQFQLRDIAPSAELEISYLGYERLIVEAADLISQGGNCKELYLKLQDFELPEIVVSRFLTRGLQKSVDDQFIINSEQFGILPGLVDPDILQTIQVLPGVESIDESINNINVRGGTQDENLMLWDDIVMYHSGHFFGLISAYNPNLTKKVSVIKNGTPSEYGGGVSSTIRMNTENEIGTKISGGVGLNGLSADAFIQIPLGKAVALQLSGRHSIADQLQTPTYQAYFKRSFQDSEIEDENNTSLEDGAQSDFKFYDYTAKLLVDLNENHKARVSFIQISNELFYAEQNAATANVTKTSNLDQQNIAIGGNLSSTWSANYSTFVNAYLTKYNIDSREFFTESEQELLQENEVLETGIKLKGIQQIGKNLEWLHGYQFTETGIRNGTRVSNPLFSQRQKDVVRSHSAFTDLTFQSSKTFLRAGLRASYFEKFEKLRLEPRLNARQKLGAHVALKAQGEFKYQTATQIIDFEEDFLGVENRRWILANDNDIPLIRSKQFSGGMEFKKNGWLLDLSAFYKNVDGITASNQGFQNQFQFIKTSGSYEVKGLEFILNKTEKKYSVYLTYTFSTNDYQFESLIPDKFPNNTDLRHSLNLAGNYSILKNLDIALGTTYHTGRPYTVPISGVETISSGNGRIVNYASPNAENLDDFLRVDASVNYSFEAGPIQGKVTLGALNVLNAENPIQQYYIVNPEDTTRALAIRNNSLGFTPNASLRINF
ncbi:TonB-dependent receptor [Leeuwenhoekiella nanhaiensis]|uniref:TonB-dependent receptor plug domain-containing protein n=1 Tax=Leeuwenhoekiella nanhaiensis TaxID=1655491 RepID=A0A2G1VSS3_9FLAO|nr:TonB-dependent receptor [Leeuwenhoekiella nanhaiensis]PHQ29509.1 hypothetical protein CJ305_09330 [Leeuwenhoekiella nanhaiensis]